MIKEPGPFDPAWYSHKSNGAGVRYEIASSIETGLMVWINGPFMAGAWSDDAIFKAFLKERLNEGEIVHADRGYSNKEGEPMIYFTPNTPGTDNMHNGNQQARARHETINGRFKRFNILGGKFRHDKDKHGICFMAVAALVHATMIMDEEPFTIDYGKTK